MSNQYPNKSSVVKFVKSFAELNRPTDCTKGYSIDNSKISPNVKKFALRREAIRLKECIERNESFFGRIQYNFSDLLRETVEEGRRENEKILETYKNRSNAGGGVRG